MYTYILYRKLPEHSIFSAHFKTFAKGFFFVVFIFLLADVIYSLNGRFAFCEHCRRCKIYCLLTVNKYDKPIAAKIHFVFTGL